METAEARQKQLHERHKKYEANTTFLPRLDGHGGQQQGTGQRGLSGARNNPPGRVVKNLASELEQLEEHSASFPEEPILRSRSAKQTVRFQAAGTRVGDGNYIPEKNKRKSAGNLASVPAGGGTAVLSARPPESRVAAALNPTIPQQRYDTELTRNY